MKWLNYTTCQCFTLKKKKKKQYHEYKMSSIKQKTCQLID